MIIPDIVVNRNPGRLLMGILLPGVLLRGINDKIAHTGNERPGKGPADQEQYKAGWPRSLNGGHFL